MFTLTLIQEEEQVGIVSCWSMYRTFSQDFMYIKPKEISQLTLGEKAHM
jgi:hypothetical protein